MSDQEPMTPLFRRSLLESEIHFLVLQLRKSDSSFLAQVPLTESLVQLPNEELQSLRDELMDMVRASGGLKK
jgi:hypothetical protein